MQIVAELIVANRSVLDYNICVSWIMEEDRMKTHDFWYDLPEELIAQTPLLPRDASRLLVLDRETGEMAHRNFYNVIEYLNPGDCLVMNDSRVLPARIMGHRPTGGVIEVLLLRDLGEDCWECLCKPGRKMQIGNTVIFGEGLLKGTVTSVREDGNRVIKFEYQGIFLEILDKLGKMPLPPYIKVELQDQERYQTVYSREVGSAAAPTAGLHFTQELLQKIRDKGVNTAFVTLHVGLGTFRPVKATEISEHHMHSELCMISDETARLLNDTRKHGGRIICVGTTSCRTLESLINEDGSFEAKTAWTDIFIYPGYRFKAMDGLITNFHLPESTLVMLVSAFAGRENVLHAYQEAVRQRYRFFSFGDAMCILNHIHCEKEADKELEK